MSLCALLVCGVLSGALAQPATAQDPVLTAPVDAPLIDHFRPPAHRWDPGNRGLTYGTTPGTVVRSPADGEVRFAGRVGFSLHVTVQHPDGLRSSVSFLHRVDVVQGQQVRRGDPLGLAGDELHFGVRTPDDEYLDPAALLAGHLPPARLISSDLLQGPPAAAARAERALFRQLEASLGGPGPLDLLRMVLPDAGVLLDALTATAPPLILLRTARDLLAWHQRSQRCSTDAVQPAPPSGRRIAVLVGGIGSTSTNAGIDDLATGVLGYDDGDVLRFSYRGGRIPGAIAADLDALGVNTYDTADTQGDLRAAGQQLADLLRAIAASAPGVPIDVFAHSQGGVVTRLALDAGSVPDEIDHVVTIAAPHNGADAATVLHVFRDKPGADLLLDDLGPVHGLEPTSPALAQLAERSTVIDSLGPVPEGVQALSIAARGDVVVSSQAAHLAGATNVIVPTSGPGAHQDVVGSAATHRAIALSLAGLSQACESFVDAMLDSTTGSLVAGVQSAVAGVLEVPRVPKFLRPSRESP